MSRIKKIIRWIAPVLLRAFVLFFDREIEKADKVRSSVRRHETHPTPDVVKRYRLRTMEPVVFVNELEVLEVLRHLRYTIEFFHYATVEDLYEMLDKSSQFLDTHYGWTDLSSATVTLMRPGVWGLYLPIPQRVVSAHD